MPHRLPDALLHRLSALMALHFGLHFPENRWRELERGLVSAAQEFDRGDVESCLEWILSSPLTREQTEILASHLTVGETYFFREHSVFAALEHRLLPDLIQSRRASGKRLRIWSTGCSTGEEPYSIAILLHRLLGAEEREWNLALLATDINFCALRRAAEGIYREWSFRNTPDELKEKYFCKVGKNRYAILPSIREKVVFAHHNLMTDSYPSILNNTNAMDIILCRNVLMYFTPEGTAGALRKFHHCLLDGGWLVTSAVEASAIPFPGFSASDAAGVPVLRKDSSVHQALGGVGSNEMLRTMPWGEPLPPDRPVPFDDGAERAAGQEWFEKAVPTPPAEDSAVQSLQQPYRSGDAESLARSAKLYADQGDLAEALDYCRQAIALNRLDPERHYLLAAILQEQGLLEEAAAALKRTLYLDPGFVLAHVALAHLAKGRGNAREAQKYVEHALDLLRSYPREAVVPRSEGLTAGRLMELIRTLGP